MENTKLHIAGSPKELLANFRGHPETFCQTMWPDEPLWAKQIEICRSIAENKETWVKSGHSCGKTHLVAKLVIWFIACFPNSIVITTAPVFRQVELQIWGEIRRAYNKAKVNFGGNMQLTPNWKIADKHFAVGLATNQPEHFQGYHSDYVLIIFDEGAGIPPAIYEARSALLASGNVKFISIGNPLFSMGDFYNAFRTTGKGRITISCFDAVKSGIKQLVSQDWIDEEKAKYEAGNNPLYEARVLGEFPTISVNTVLSIAQIERAMRNPVTIIGDFDTFVSADVGFQGTDETVLTAWHGTREIGKEPFNEPNSMATVGRILLFLKKYDTNVIFLDGDGGGKVIGDRLREQGVDVRPIHSASTDGIGEEFCNLRAAMWWNAREMMNEGIVSLIDDPQTREQLSLVTYHRHSSGKILIDSKEDIRKEWKLSPDRADSVVYGLWGAKMMQAQHQPKEPKRNWIYEETAEEKTEQVLGVRSY